MGDLNGLMRALRDEIALADIEGATVEAVLAGIQWFYQNKAKQQLSNQADVSLQNIDRAFQERVWSWLTKDRLISVGKSKEGNSLTLNEVEARNLEPDPLRIFTTEQQIWITLTGNEKDTRKIPNKSFELLSVIAAHREKGITQPELTRITGQDKRSVPSRTQKLAEAGHIKKIAVLAKSANTSLLVHSKFFAEFSNLNIDTRAGRSVNTEPGPSDVLVGRNKFIRIEKEIRLIIELLENSENRLMLWDDIRAKCTADAFLSRLLAGAVRKLEDLGITARVRAPKSRPTNNNKQPLFRCIQLLRSPTEEDWRALFHLSKKEHQKLSELAPTHNVPDKLHDIDPMISNKADGLLNDKEATRDVANLSIPLWNPDRLLTHTIYSALLEAGTKGLSTKDLKKMTTGLFYSRPIDHLLHRCVKAWQKSQPPHLQHLAIVRDSAQLGKTSFYIHFTHDAFGVKVENGETFWEAIQSYSGPHQVSTVDKYGFEILQSSIFAGNRNDFTLKKALELAESNDQASLASDRNISQRSQFGAVRRPRNPSLLAARQGSGTTSPLPPLGRPRKYPIVNGAIDLSKMSTAQMKKVVLSQKRAQEYVRKKAHKEVQVCVSSGMSKDEAEAFVITELGLTPESYLRNTIEEPDISTMIPKSRYLKPLTYLPSIIAHTVPLCGYSVHSFNSVEESLSGRKKSASRPKQSIQSYQDRQDEHNSDGNAESHPPKAQNLFDGGNTVVASFSKRKTSTNKLSENPSKRQRHSFAVESNIQTLQENNTGAENSIPNNVAGTPAETPLQTTNIMSDQDPGQIDATDSRSQTPSNTQPLPITSPLPSPSVDTASLHRIVSEKASPIKQKRQRVAPFGGTIAAMRRLIILDIVKACNGVFPGDSELVQPFITAYARKFPGAKPDSKTIKLAKTTLIGEGQLRQIFFTFKAATKTIHTKSIIALPEISDTDEHVKELQDAISKAHPSPYFPPGTDIRADLMPKSTIVDADNNRVFGKTMYTKDLPVISDFVVPQLEVESRKQHEASTATNLADPNVLPTAKPISSKSKQKKLPSGDNSISDKNQQAEKSVGKRTYRKRPNDSVAQDKPAPKKPRRSKQSSQAQAESTEIASPATTSPATEQTQGHEALTETRPEIPHLEAQSDQEAIPGQALAMQSHMADPRIYPPLQPYYSANAVPEMRPQYNPQYNSPSTVQANGSFNNSIPMQVYPPFMDLMPNNGMYGIGLPVIPPPFMPPKDNFVHYSFPMENFVSVPVYRNPVGRKRIHKELPPKKIKDKSRDLQVTETPSSLQLPTESAVDGNGVESPKSTPKIRKPRTVAPRPSALELHEQKQEKTPGIRYSKNSRTQSRQIEYRRERHNWEPKNDRKLLIAVLFCHVACGGIREENHWAIVSKMLSHMYDEELCRRRWTSIRSKYRRDMELIYLELRSALLDSYEKSEMPMLDYAHIWQNDWEGILAWAVEKIEHPTSEEIDLPISRQAFESIFSIQDLPLRECPDFFEQKRVASVPLRQSALNNGARVLTKETENQPTELEVAKSYILANVLTPQKEYDAEKARGKLLDLSEATVERATNSLLADKIIAQTNRGRAAPGRTYDVSRFYLKALEWKLSVPHFKYAAAFKEILDKKLEMDGRMQYKQAFGNGEMIALINLLADGLVELEGKNIPNNKFGLATEGYKTRTIDKKVYNFVIQIKPRKQYTMGNPCLPLPQPPSQDHSQVTEGAKPSLNPLWIDINGDLLPLMWDLAVAAVASILVADAGSTIENVAKILQPSMNILEVKLVMEWLVEAGAAAWKDERHDCLNLKTWWWSVITTPIAKNSNTKEATMIAGQPMQQ